MTDEMKDNSFTIEDGVAEDDAKQACALCLHDFKKSTLTLFDLNKDGREHLLCSTCLSKVNGTYQNPQGSGQEIYTTAGGRNFDVMRGPARSRLSNVSPCLRCILPIWGLCLVFSIWIAVNYCPTLKWKSVEGTISEPCIVDYEIDGHTYDIEAIFNCKRLGPYELLYNPKDPDEVMSADLQKVMLSVAVCLAFGIPYILIVTYICRRYDVVPMLKRRFRRS